MLLLKLNKIERIHRSPATYVDADDEGERPAATVEVTRVVFVNADKIRNFQPRRDNATGSRLTFTDGGGYAVQETPEEIIGFLGADVLGRSADVVQIADQRSQH